MPHRIVFQLDDPRQRCGFLRETAGDFTPLESDPFVVIAKEFDESGACLRSSWARRLRCAGPRFRCCFEIRWQHRTRLAFQAVRRWER